MCGNTHPIRKCTQPKSIALNKECPFKVNQYCLVFIVLAFSAHYHSQMHSEHENNGSRHTGKTMTVEKRYIASVYEVSMSFTDFHYYIKKGNLHTETTHQFCSDIFYYDSVCG